jgi:hypothetical protein
MRSLTRRRIGVITTLLGLTGVGVGLAATPASAASVEPILVTGDGNPSCGELAADFSGGQTWIEIKLEGDDLSDGPHTVGGVTVTLSNVTSHSFDWSATVGIDAVLVKAGSSDHNFYLYAPNGDAAEPTSDTGLQASGQNAISHISFCYDQTNPTTTTTSTTAPSTTSSVPETTTTTVAETTTTTVPETTTTTVPETTTTTVAETTTTTVPETTTTTDPAVAGSSTTVTTAPTQVLGTQQSRPLPRTGSDTGALVAFSLGLIAVGLGMILLGNGAQVLAVRRR